MGRRGKDPDAGELAARMPNVKLVVAGGNHPMTPGYVESVAASMADDDRVEFTGYVAEDGRTSGYHDHDAKPDHLDAELALRLRRDRSVRGRALGREAGLAGLLRVATLRRVRRLRLSLGHDAHNANL